jgi:hypothetical protein
MNSFTNYYIEKNSIQRSNFFSALFVLVAKENRIGLKFFKYINSDHGTHGTRQQKKIAKIYYHKNDI